MAGLTNHAYRRIVGRLGGVGLPVTEMVSAGLPARGPRRPASRTALGHRREPRPLAVQIWDNDPENLAAVGRRLVVEFQASVVDINFGCPCATWPIAPRAGPICCGSRSGGPHRRPCGRRVPPVPVTAKIRLGCDPRHDQRHRRGAGGRSGRRRGGDGARPHGGRSLSRHGRLGRDCADQAAT